jgi:hypothetical protein
VSQDFADYAADQVACIFLAVPLQGKGDGPFCRIRYMSPAFSSKAGSDGLVSRSRSNDQRAEVTIILETTSASNAALSAAITAGLNFRNGRDIGPLLIQDMSGFSLYTAEKAWVVQFPDREYARETGQAEWKIECAKLVAFEGGN